MAFDRFGRIINYLRISLTDHCNLRCEYCMPEDIVFRPSAELMQDDEILLLAKLFAELGFNKIRLTGGEPTIRQNVVQLVRDLAGIRGIESISMTTNGTFLKKLAQPLAEAGLRRVNISIDTLNPYKFKSFTRWGEIDDVWEGIHAAERAGLEPIKLNAVIVRGYNEEDIVDLAKLTCEHPWQVRFIEMMPLGDNSDFQEERLVTMQEVQERIENALGSLIPGNNGRMDGEARVYRLPNSNGDIGFISSVSAPFCLECNRARLTPDGILRMCLLQELEVDLLTPLRSGAGGEKLRRLILEAIWNKPWGHGLEKGEIPANRGMSEIGG